MSPAFQLNEFGRPVKLINSALTNRPNFTLPPIINSETEKEKITEEHDMDIEALKEEIVNAVLERMKAEEQPAAETENTETEATEEAKPETEETKTEETETAAEETTNGCGTETEEKTQETANACGTETPKETENTETDEKETEEVIKPEALNSTNETAPTVAGTLKQAEEWRSLHGEALLQWCRKHPETV